MKKSKVCLAICSSLVTMSLLTTSYCSVFASGDQAKTGGDLPLTVGVVSDVHLTDDGANKTDETFKNVLQYYKEIRFCHRRAGERFPGESRSDYCTVS